MQDAHIGIKWVAPRCAMTSSPIMDFVLLSRMPYAMKFDVTIGIYEIFEEGVLGKPNCDVVTGS